MVFDANVCRVLWTTFAHWEPHQWHEDARKDDGLDIDEDLQIRIKVTSKAVHLNQGTVGIDRIIWHR